MGQRTGRAAGYCAGYPAPGYANPVPGRGFWARGRGGGRGRRNWFHATGLPRWARAGLPAEALAKAGAGIPPWGGYPPYGAEPTGEQEVEALKGQAEYFRGVLEDIKKRIEELEAGKEAE